VEGVLTTQGGTMIPNEDRKKEAAYTNPHEDLEDNPIPTFDEWIAGFKSDKRQRYIDEFFEGQLLWDIKEWVWDVVLTAGSQEMTRQEALDTVKQLSFSEIKDRLDVFGITSGGGMQDDDFIEFMNKAYREEFNLSF
jgi:hypothetical protein